MPLLPNKPTNRRVTETTLPAFTISEMVTVMAVSALLLVIVYAAMAAIEHRYHLFFAQAKRQTQISLLENTLQKDIEQAEGLYWNANRLTVTYKQDAYTTQPRTATEYAFRDTVIIRTQQTVMDTFYVRPDSLICHWQGKNLVQTTDPADELFFKGLVNGETYLFHFHKSYDYQTLWKLEQQTQSY
ncbi:hypothetical protein QNI19_32745 [Cytophagaceae bacterium DM2B3-1]|uniref:Prepilin-type N-terminal cleavage/methylation domain-containing protein n=1 Tax=Xanthocytophaga flava TaxID=3048013 RepID=A0ABT7CVL2_9BACT|nr:hypothetical protein [Xanthocytophaga flavus]MDJ1497755.1 hypothetical protein [Xanthocytophaga flavus]